MSQTIRILPYHYIHVLDKNSSVCRLVKGPQTFVKQDHEEVVTGSIPIKMIIIPPRQYVKILNPVLRDQEGNILKDSYGQVRVRFGEYQYRFNNEYKQPFPLFPGEELKEGPSDLQIVKEGSALRVKANRNFQKGDQEILAGDEWLFPGPATYIPRVEEDPVAVQEAPIIRKGEALRLRATLDFESKQADGTVIQRTLGEEWLVRTEGAYQPGVYELVVDVVKPFRLTESNAVILQAEQSFTDHYGVFRNAGEQWLVSREQSSTHVLDVHEKFVKEAKFVVLSKREYCVILDPFDHERGANRLGTKLLREGPAAFFLHPGESLEDDVQEIRVLGEREALLVRAREEYTQRRFQDPVLRERIQEILSRGAQETEITLIKNKRNGHIRAMPSNDVKSLKDFEEIHTLSSGESITDFVQDIQRSPGEQWMEYGPLSYLPPVEVEVVRKVEEIPLDTNEGIYIRDNRSGDIRSHFGETYMLKPHESLWEMDIPAAVEKLLVKANGGDPIDKTRVISYKAPYNSAVQIYNYRKKESRIVFGPNLVSLEPDEIFTVNVLSGGKPKVPGVIKSLVIKLGPDFTSDFIEVETSDHARLRIKLSYNWHFDVDKENKESSERVFSIKDFIGDMCTILAAKIRSAVAGVNFESFHKGFAKLIRTTIFGVDENGKIKGEFRIEKNGLVITNVDIRNVEPVDEQTRESLKETVSLAIEITTKGQEEEARRESNRTKQQAEGELERLQISYQSKAEEAEKKLLELKGESIQIRNSGKAEAEARALAEVEIAKLTANAIKVEEEAKIERTRQVNEINVGREQSLSEIRLERQSRLADAEAKKFEEIMNSLGKETVVAISNVSNLVYRSRAGWRAGFSYWKDLG